MGSTTERTRKAKPSDRRNLMKGGTLQSTRKPFLKHPVAYPTWNEKAAGIKLKLQAEGKPDNTFPILVAEQYRTYTAEQKTANPKSWHLNLISFKAESRECLLWDRVREETRGVWKLADIYQYTGPKIRRDRSEAVNKQWYESNTWATPRQYQSHSSNFKEIPEPQKQHRGSIGKEATAVLEVRTEAVQSRSDEKAEAPERRQRIHSDPGKKKGKGRDGKKTTEYGLK